jgi:hypothetical protein
MIAGGGSEDIAMFHLFGKGWGSFTRQFQC